MRAWGWNGFGERGFERFWRYVHPHAVDRFGGHAFVTASDDPRGPTDRLADVLSTIAAAGVRYRHEVPFLPEEGGQYLRDPAMVQRAREATCIDMTIVVAGACMRASLHPWVVFGMNLPPHPEPAAHAWVVVDLDPEHERRGAFGPRRGDPTFDGNLAAWEATLLAGPDVAELVEEPSRLLDLVRARPDRFRVIDVARLCLDYPHGDPTTADLDDGPALFQPWDRLEVSDVGWWWRDARCHPTPGTEALEPLLDPLWGAGVTADGSNAMATTVAVGPLFKANARVVPFVETAGYAKLTGQIDAWLQGLRLRRATSVGLGQVGLAVMTGVGGAGKTRTALECVEELFGPHGSLDPFTRHGVLSHRAPDDRIAALASEPGMVVIIIDYAETLPSDRLEQLRQHLERRPADWGQVLILATGRERGDWLDTLIDGLGHPIADIRLGAAAPANMTPPDLYLHASTAYANYLATHHPAVLRREPGALTHPELLSGASTLEILLRAALATLGEISEDAPISHVYEEALRHERNHWRHIVDKGASDQLGDDRHAGADDDRRAPAASGTWSRALRRDISLMTAITSLAHPSREGLDRVLEQLRLHEIIGELIDLLYGDPATTHAATNAGRRLDGIAPDPLADHLITTLLGEADSWHRITPTLDTLGAWPAALTVLDRAYGTDPPSVVIGQLAEAMLARTDLLHDALEVANRSDGPTRRALAALTALPDCPPELLRAAADSSLTGLASLRVRPMERRVAALRDLADDDPDRQGELAEALVRLALRRHATGDYDMALDATEEGVAIFRALALNDSSHLPHLATALDHLGNRYAAVGRHHDALAATRESVTVFRTLAADDTAQLPDLAMALGNLGARYSDVGSHQDALSTTRETVATYRALTEDDATYRTNLAGVLNNLSLHLAELGHYAAALEAIEEAVAVYRPLASIRPSSLISPWLWRTQDSTTAPSATTGRV